jgi:hypothetical protein
MSDLEALRAQAEAGATEAGAGGGSADGAGGGDGASGAAVAEAEARIQALQVELKSLQSKLSEYEIIEDDIADLTLYKEENQKLKDEVEKLRSTAGSGGSDVAVEEPATPAVAETASETVAEEASVAKDVADVVEAPKPKASESFRLDESDAVMNEFAKAIGASQTESTEPEVEATPAVVSEAAAGEKDGVSELVVSNADVPIEDPQAAIDALLKSEAESAEPSGPALEGDLDTDKMLSEIAELDVSLESAPVLEDEVDTDKLMNELAMGASTNAPASATSVSKDAPVEDLLAEFNDADFQASQKN